jgi:AP-1 complex subunit mu
MKCYLSGMPELRLGLNDKVMFESTGRGESNVNIVLIHCVKFHQCVRLARFENDRTISFIPPDGEFELMSYRLSTPVKPLIWVEASVENHKGSRVEYVVKVKGQFKRRSTANNVEIYVPVPDDADSPKFRVSRAFISTMSGSLKRSIASQASVGSVVYAPEKSAFVWKIKQLGGVKEYLMRAHFGLPSVRNGMLLVIICTIAVTDSAFDFIEEVDKRAPISVKFEIPYFTGGFVRAVLSTGTVWLIEFFRLSIWNPG